MTKSVFVSIVGRTNAGKSSLLNKIIGEKIASVSSKPQTTRTRITGIRTEGGTQMVFMDTPGLHKPKNKLSNHMLSAAKSSVADMDAVIFMMDCTNKFVSDEETELLQTLMQSKSPVILVINKIDLLEDKSELISLITEMSGKYSFISVVPVSVINNDGVSIILDEVKKLAKDSPHYFPEDKFTDQPERVLAAEMIREKLLRCLDKEVPHGIAVGIEQMDERDDKDILDIDAVIYCERMSHKGIVIGKNGTMLKKIASQARHDLERFFQIQVNLKCWVKVKEDWRNKEGLIKNFGLSDEGVK